MHLLELWVDDPLIEELKRRNFDLITEALKRYYKLLEQAREQIAARCSRQDSVNILRLAEGIKPRDLYGELFVQHTKPIPPSGVVGTLGLLRAMSEVERWATVDALETYLEVVHTAEVRGEALPASCDLFR